MAESSIMWTTGALGDGTNPYTMAQIVAWLNRQVGSGIHIGYLNACEPTEAAPNVAIDTGAACIHGYPYENTASVNVNIPTPVGDTRIDRIVLRASWAAQTVRITRIAGIEGGAAPAITQTDGVTWDEMICQASITVGGVITVTDERTYTAPYGQILTERLEDGILTNDAAGRLKMAAGYFGADATSRAKFAADLWGADAASRAKFEADFFDTATLLDLFETDSVTNAVLIDLILDGAFQADAASRALFADLFVTEAKLANDAVTSAKIVNGAIVNADINAAAAIDQSKISNAAQSINADQVDGYDAADFATADDMHDVQETVGDTASGNVAVPVGFANVDSISKTINPDQTVDLFIWFSCSIVNASQTRTLSVKMLADGNDLGTFTQTCPLGEVSTFSACWIETGISSGARVVVPQWSASGLTITADERTMIVSVIPQ